MEKRPKTITINRFFQGGIVVYQIAKLAMLEFYYDFLDHYVDRSDFELMQMDTDSLYFASSAEKLEAVIKPHLREEFEEWKHAWLVCTPEDKRTPGLFKLEKQGKRMIAICSKCYYIDAGPDSPTKVSAKRVSQRQNPLRWERYNAALQGANDTVTNRGFRMHHGAMYTYEQCKRGLSAYYDKRVVLPDGIHTDPLEYHTPAEQ